MPNIWVCKSNNGDGPGVGDAYQNLIKKGIGGFNLAEYDPTKFKTLEELNKRINKDLGTWQPGHVTGRSFGKQFWDIGHSVQLGDWFFLECPRAAEKKRDAELEKGKRGPQRTFIVAAGIVTGPYMYKPTTSCTHQLKVDWQWTGMELIDYPFQMMTFVNIDSSRPEILATLKAIWTPGKGIVSINNPDKPSNQTVNPVTEAVSLDRDWEEGEVVLRQHLAIERSQAAAKFAKEAARKRSKGVIHCDACGMAPSKAYGEEIIEAHHVIPLADTKGMARTPTPDDFAMLCPNCHRAVHRVLTKGFVSGRDAIETVRKTVFSRRS
jgi:hypothetical protein